MKKYLTALTVSVVSLTLAGAALAQTSTRPSGAADDSKAKRSSQDTERTTWTPQPTAVESSKLIGMKVRTADGKDIGQIDQVVVNQSDGKITHVILNKGGVLGVGGEKLVLTWRDVKLQHDVDNPDKWVAVGDQAKIDRAPKYEARSSETPPAASPSTAPASRPSGSRTK
jgi:sporulation protein YlmC with PRC-barrel domain